MKYTLIFAAVIILLSGVFSCQSSSEAELASGVWRATLKTQSGAEVPFNFEVIDSAGRQYINILNGKETFRVNGFILNQDSVFIHMPLFDTEIRAKIRGKSLSGHWIKHFPDSNMSMQFTAKPHASERFFKVNAGTEFNISGRWSVTFTSTDNTDTTVAIGEFSQDNGRLFGTFLKSTGDSRFLEGTISDEKLYLSGFDGANAYLFTGKLMNDSTIVDGKFYSGFASIQNWAAKKDAKALLPDPYSLTVLKPGYNKIDFAFPGLDSKKVSLSDDKFKNKVVIVQFLGTWCPNCMDETVYLASFYNKYKAKGVEVIGLAYERTQDFERSKNNVKSLQKRLDVPYDILVTGFNNDINEVARSLPMLKTFIAFPTMIIIDKKGLVRKIHTGFSGPGTGKHYTDFIKEFEHTIENLLEEK